MVLPVVILVAASGALYGTWYLDAALTDEAMSDARAQYWEDPRPPMCPHGPEPAFLRLYEVPEILEDCRIEITPERLTVCGSRIGWSLLLWSVEEWGDQVYHLEAGDVDEPGPHPRLSKLYELRDGVLWVPAMANAPGEKWAFRRLELQPSNSRPLPPQDAP